MGCFRRLTRTPTLGEDQTLQRLNRENEKNPDRSNIHYIAPPERPKRLVSLTRLVMGLLLIAAIPIFIRLANQAVLAFLLRRVALRCRARWLAPTQSS
jgi:hypothetical protein